MTGESNLNRFWFRQLRKMIAAEEAGADPRQFTYRYIVLSRMLDRKVTFKWPHNLQHFLDDADIRSRDGDYSADRALVRKWLDDQPL